MSTENRCIYCNSSDNLCRRAHIVPRSLGTFKNQPTLKNIVCCECDKEIGRCEEQIVKCGPEAILRLALDIRGRSGSNSISPFRRGHAGHEPISFKTTYPGTDYEVLVEIIRSSQNCRLLPQVVIIHENGNCDQVLVTKEDLTAEVLKEQIKSKGIDSNTKLWVTGDTEEDQKRINTILEKTGLIKEIYKELDLQPCESPVVTEGLVKVDAQYFRAIAKIAFHYFLAFNNDFNGLNPVFKGIRNFIRYGEGKFKSFIEQKQGPLVEELKYNYRPRYYGHFLIGEIGRRNVSCMIQFFIGKDIDPQFYTVTLGEKEGIIEFSPRKFGHFYAYLEPDKRDAYDGIIQKLGHNERIILPPASGLILIPQSPGRPRGAAPTGGHIR